MRTLLLCIALILPAASFADIEPKAIASEMVSLDNYSHYNEVYKKIMAWQKANVKEVKKVMTPGSPERLKFLTQLNEWLKEFNLPQLASVENVALVKTCRKDESKNPDCFRGFEIDDGSTRFCFPCAGRSLLKQQNDLGLGANKTVEPIAIKDIPEAIPMPRGGLNNTNKKSSKGRN